MITIQQQRGLLACELRENGRLAFDLRRGMMSDGTYVNGLAHMKMETLIHINVYWYGDLCTLMMPTVSPRCGKINTP